MTKLFDNTQFGDIFYTTENKRAVFLRFAENSEYNFAILYVEDWGTIQVFRGSGKEVHGEVAYDIIGKKKPALPSNLDEAANNYGIDIRLVYPRAMDETDRYIYNAFKAGAEWMAGKGEKATATVGYYNQSGLSILTKPSIKKLGFEEGDELEITIRKK